MLRHPSTLKEIPFIQEAISAIKTSLKGRIESYTDISEGDFAEPYYLFTFNNK